jgi:hypothetical protein
VKLNDTAVISIKILAERIVCHKATANGQKEIKEQSKKSKIPNFTGTSGSEYLAKIIQRILKICEAVKEHAKEKTCNQCAYHNRCKRNHGLIKAA